MTIEQENLNNTSEPAISTPASKPKVRKWLVWTFIIVLLTGVGFFGWYLGSKQNSNLKNQNSGNDYQPVIVNPSTLSTTETKLPVENITTSAITKAEKTVTDFEDTYLAYSNDTSSEALRKKTLYDFFITPTNQKDLDYQKTLAGLGSGGPVLLGSASAGDALQSYEITKKPTDEKNLVFEVSETTFNGVQGNTKKAIRTNVIEIIKVGDKYLIKYYYPKGFDKEMFSGFTAVGKLADGFYSLTIDQLLNTTYLVSDQTVLLNKGTGYLVPTLKGEDKNNWQVTIGYPDSNRYSYGDLDLDGDLDNAVILGYSAGGTGYFYDLNAVINNNGKPESVDRVGLPGDRINIKSLKIENNIISLKIMTHADGQALVDDPTVEKVLHYKLVNNKLNIIK